MTDDNLNLAELFGNVAQAIATRPQKSSVVTNTVSNSTPYALADMIRARDTIGDATNSLSDILKARETPLYATLKALGQVQGSSEPGKWLESGLRGLSTGYTSLDDIKAENAQALYKAQMEDLAQRLAYDKSMGEKQTQYQRQDMDYKDMPWAGAGGKGGSQSSQWQDFDFSGLGDQFDMIQYIKDHPELYSSTAQVAGEVGPDNLLTTRGLLARQMVKDKDLGIRSGTIDQVRKIASSRISQAVKELGGARGMDTLREAQIRVGKIIDAPYQTAEEFATNLDIARQDLFKELNNARYLQQLPLMKESDFNRYWNSMWGVPMGIPEEDRAKYVTKRGIKTETPETQKPKVDLDAIYESIANKSTGGK